MGHRWKPPTRGKSSPTKRKTSEMKTKINYVNSMDSQPSTHVSSDGPNPLLFIKEVAKYFMDFLETDFHKQRVPKRVVRLKDSNSLLVGINLRKYPSFHQKIPYLVSKGFANSLANEISRGSYRA